MTIPPPQANSNASDRDLQKATVRAWRDHEFDRNVTASTDAKANAVLAATAVISAVYAAIFANMNGSLPTPCVIMLACAATTGALAVIFALAALRVRLRGLLTFESEQEASEYYIFRANDEAEYEYIAGQRFYARRIILVKGRCVNNSVVCLVIALIAMQCAIFLR